MSGLEERPSGDHEAASAGEGEEGKRPATPEAGVREPAAATTAETSSSAWETRKIIPYLRLLDFAGRPESKLGWIVRGLAVGIAVLLLLGRVNAATKPLLSAKPPAVIPTQEIDDYRFRLPERTRREIFRELATAELAERARAIAANSWNGHIWSREDDRGYQERVAARAAAAKHKVSLSQIYLVLDEGIRERWPGPDGKPLPATTPPLDIRSNSW
ncbi:MAG TPA: hypothetical protein VM925_35855 [Labilithrix sp.]|nr:hypothetical protein [Labilithrix sp.]